MKIVMDAVFNHTGREFFAFEDIMEKGEKSKYLDWYYIEKFPLKSERGEIPNYKCFGYYGGMPKLNLKNPEVEKFITDVACYWIKECNIDGWRMDVGDEISHYFWKNFRRAVKAVKKDMLIIGEIWHYAGDFLEGDEWDTVMNYPFYLNLIDLLKYTHVFFGSKAAVYTIHTSLCPDILHPSTCPACNPDRLPPASNSSP